VLVNIAGPDGVMQGSAAARIDGVGGRALFEEGAHAFEVAGANCVVKVVGAFPTCDRAPQLLSGKTNLGASPTEHMKDATV